MQSPSNAVSDRSLAERANPWLAFAFVLAAAAAAGIWHTPQRINHDCAFYLQQAEMLLDGATPYCGFVDINPPLIDYLNVPPVWLARCLNISPIVAFQGLVLMLLFLSTLEIGLLVRQRRWGLRAAEQGIVVLTWMALYFLIDWHGDIGQREHLFALLYVPYLFLRILRYRGGSVAAWFATLLGVQAGLGVSVKPHFLVIAAVVEIVLLMASRRWRTLARPECAALVGVVAAYLAHWLFVPAAMRAEYFGRWAPLLYRSYFAYYVGYGETVRGILGSPSSAAGLVGVLAAALLLCIQRRSTGRRPRLRQPLLALAMFGVMALAVVLFQQKGWSYHRIPLEIAGLLCLAMVVLSGRKAARMHHLTGQRADIVPLLRRSSAVGDSSRGTACEQAVARGAIWGATARRSLAWGILGILLAVWFVGRTESTRVEPPEYMALRRIVAERSRPGDRVVVIATSVRPAYPMLLQMDRRPGSRYLCSFPIALLYAGAEPTADRPLYRRYEEAPAEERRFLDELRDDVEQLQPRLIIVQAGAGWIGLPKDFNTFEYLLSSGWAKRALKPYREIPGPQGWKVFERM